MPFISKDTLFIEKIKCSKIECIGRKIREPQKDSRIRKNLIYFEGLTGRTQQMLSS
jgi:hypothetical protein